MRKLCPPFHLVNHPQASHPASHGYGPRFIDSVVNYKKDRPPINTLRLIEKATKIRARAVGEEIDGQDTGNSKDSKENHPEKSADHGEHSKKRHVLQKAQSTLRLLR